MTARRTGPQRYARSALRWIGAVLVVGLITTPMYPTTSTRWLKSTALVPAHPPISPDLQLAAVDGDRLAAVRGGGELLTGTVGSTLTSNGVQASADVGGSWPQPDLTGNVLRWAEVTGEYSTIWVRHTVDLLTRVDSQVSGTEEPVAYTPDGWYGYDKGVLTQHRRGRPNRIWLTDINPDSEDGGGAPAVRADANGAVVLYLARAQNLIQHLRVVLITSGRARPELLADATPSETPTTIREVALSPHSVVWTTLFDNSPAGTVGGGTNYVHRRSRSGGPVTDVKTPQSNDLADLAATDDQVSVTELQGPPAIWALTGTSWRKLPLPEPGPSYTTPSNPDIDHGRGEFGGIRASGTQFTFMLSTADPAVAGVYRSGSGDPTRVSTVTDSQVISDVALSNGRLVYGERPASVATENPVPLWGLSVHVQAAAQTAPAAIVLGPQQRLTYSVVHPAGSTIPDLAISGTRTASTSISNHDTTLSDGEVDTADLPFPVPATDPLKLSGPYALVGHQIWPADQGDVAGDPLWTLEGVTSAADLFGSRVVWSTTYGAVHLRDLSRLDPAAPRILTPQGAAGPVATWGTTVAWLRTDGSIAITDLTGEKSRVVTVSGTVKDLRMSDGTLDWQDGAGRLWLLDLHSSTSRPVDSGLHAPGAVDDHLIAGLDAAGRLQVKTLPFGLSTAHRPRLLGVLHGSLFAPIGDHAWRPQFDVSKPVDQVRLEIRRKGRLVRTLTGTGATGAIRDLHWNGKSLTGQELPADSYDWTLTATAQDGEGTLTSAEGLHPVTGTLRLSR